METGKWPVCVCVCVCVCVSSVMSDSLPPWIVACQAPLSMGIFQVKILEWVAISSSWGSSQPRDQTHVSYTLQADSLALSHWGTDWHGGRVAKKLCR